MRKNPVSFDYSKLFKSILSIKSMLWNSLLTTFCSLEILASNWYEALLINFSYFLIYVVFIILKIVENLKVVSATFVLVYFLSLNESTCQTRKNVFLFHFKSSFRSRKNILEFYLFKFHDVIKCLSIKQIHFTE